MTLEQLIVQQALEIANLKEKLGEFKKASADIKMHMVGIGGPLNDNNLKYSKEQREIFHFIFDSLNDLEDI